MGFSNIWRSRLPVVLLVLATGAALGAYAPIALADDPPPATTVPTPTLPAPVPAPTPSSPVKKPAPKKSAPAPAPRRATPTPSVSHTPAPAPAAVAPLSRVRPQTHAKAKKAVHRRHRKTHKKIAPIRPAPVEKVKAGQVRGVSTDFLPTAVSTGSGSSFNLGALFVILGCAIAIACFAIALVPATAVPWRPVAGFISQRQLDLTLTGLTLLVAVLTFYFITGA